jgi:DNA-binding NarL/FixJ family response regulator
VVQAALSDGARGYILKADAWRELLTAVDQVVGGNYFLSSGIEKLDSDKTFKA